MACFTKRTIQKRRKSIIGEGHIFIYSCVPSLIFLKSIVSTVCAHEYMCHPAPPPPQLSILRRHWYYVFKAILIDDQGQLIFAKKLSCCSHISIKSVLLLLKLSYNYVNFTETFHLKILNTLYQRHLENAPHLVTSPMNN